MNDPQSLRPDSDDESTNTSANPGFDSILQARLSRPQMLGGVSSALAAASGQGVAAPGRKLPKLAFNPVAKSIADVVAVPDGYRYTVLYRSGDPIDSSVGEYLNDGTDPAGSFALRISDPRIHARLALLSRQLDGGRCYPEESLAPIAGSDAAPNLIVPRSLGKFFGLAGARVGFLFASPEVCERFASRLGPWTIAGPSREVARLALSDRSWQRDMRPYLCAAGQRLVQMLEPIGVAGRRRCSQRFLPHAQEKSTKTSPEPAS